MRVGGRAVGLYSIGLRDMPVPELATWASHNGIPFLHLRGGVRGCQATSQSQRELERWRAVADETAPIRLLTADVTLGELTEGPGRRAAEDQLAQTVNAAARLGAAMIRVLADSTPSDPGRISVPRLPDAEITLLIEPHNRWWWTRVGTGLLSEMTEVERRIRLLADTAQAAVGLASLDDDTAEVVAGAVIAKSQVVHLSDNGSGFDTTGHGLLATQAWNAKRTGQEIEVAFEWTGTHRTKPVCLSRYHAACAWWLAQDETYINGGQR